MTAHKQGRLLFYNRHSICYYFPMLKNNKNLRAVVITAEGFEDEEVIYPVIRLKEEGFAVDIATKDKKLVLGRLNFPLELIVRYYGTLVDATKLDAKNYELVLIPGGFEAPDRMRQVPVL